MGAAVEQDIPLPRPDSPRQRGARLPEGLPAGPPRRAKITSSISQGWSQPARCDFAWAVLRAQLAQRIQMHAVRRVSSCCSFWSLEHFSLCSVC